VEGILLPSIKARHSDSKTFIITVDVFPMRSEMKPTILVKNKLKNKLKQKVKTVTAL